MDWKTILSDLKDAGFTREQVAAQCDCSQATISDLANGITAEPKYALGERIRAFHHAQCEDRRRKRAKARA